MYIISHFARSMMIQKEKSVNDILKYILSNNIQRNKLSTTKHLSYAPFIHLSLHFTSTWMMQ